MNSEHHLETMDEGPGFRATVVATQRLTPAESPEEIRELTLEVDRGDFDYEIGQSIGVRAPGRADLGQQHHFRLYSIADLPERGPSGLPRIRICVRRCDYLDDYSGEELHGIASNYLCDLKEGADLTITGPHGMPFPIPEEPDASLLLIGTGTGIAPFRALVKRLHAEGSGFHGKIMLFYGAYSGLELLYMNDEQRDLSQYYDRDTFEAFHALSPRPHWSDPIGWDHALGQRGEQILALLEKPATYVFVAGLEPMRDALDKVFATLVGSPEAWAQRKADLEAAGRWVELLY